jgi:hypothetical protein
VARSGLEALVIRIAALALAGALLFGVAVLESRVEEPPGPRDAPPEAAAAVREFITLARHYEASGGDRRFAERLPATEAMVAEIRGGAEWERHLSDSTVLEPVRVDVLSAKLDRAGAATVRTREYLIAHVRIRSGPSGFEEQDRAVVGAWEYRLVRAGASWRVADWAPVVPEEGSR